MIRYIPRIKKKKKLSRPFRLARRKRYKKYVTGAFVSNDDHLNNRTWTLSIVYPRLRPGLEPGLAWPITKYSGVAAGCTLSCPCLRSSVYPHLFIHPGSAASTVLPLVPFPPFLCSSFPLAGTLLRART